MDKRCKVFIVEHDPDTLELFKMVVEAEHDCEVSTALASLTPDTFENIKQVQPDLIIMDFVHRRMENWQLLCRLRSDDATTAIPVLSISTADQIVERSLASYNVRKILVKPFEMEEFDKSVRELLTQPRVILQPRPVDDPFQEAANILMSNARTVIEKWQQMVQELEPFKTHKLLRPPDVLNELPIVLWGIIVSLRLHAPQHLLEEDNETFRQVAISHAQSRRQQGASLGTLVHEYKLLRNAVTQALRDNYPKGKWTVENVLDIADTVNLSLDDIVVIAVEAYGQGKA